MTNKKQSKLSWNTRSQDELTSDGTDEFTFDDPPEGDLVLRRLETIANTMDIHKNGILYLKELTAIGHFLIAYMRQTKKQTMKRSTFVANVHKAYMLDKFNLKEALNVGHDEKLREDEVHQIIQHVQATSILSPSNSLTYQPLSARSHAKLPSQVQVQAQVQAQAQFHATASVSLNHKQLDNDMPVNSQPHYCTAQADIYFVHGPCKTNSKVPHCFSDRPLESGAGREAESKEAMKAAMKARLLSRFKEADSISEEAELVYELKQEQKRRFSRELQLNESKSRSRLSMHSMMDQYKKDRRTPKARPGIRELHKSTVSRSQVVGNLTINVKDNTSVETRATTVFTPFGESIHEATSSLATSTTHHQSTSSLALPPPKAQPQGPRTSTLLAEARRSLPRKMHIQPKLGAECPNQTKEVLHEEGYSYKNQMRQHYSLKRAKSGNHHAAKTVRAIPIVTTASSRPIYCPASSPNKATSVPLLTARPKVERVPDASTCASEVCV